MPIYTGLKEDTIRKTWSVPNFSALQEKAIEASLVAGQIETNKIEAESKSIFVAGWRPATGWICVLALGYKFLFHPILTWAWCLSQARGWLPVDAPPPPMIDANALYPIIMGMLGLGTMRTVEGIKNVKTNSLASVNTKKEGGFKWPWSK